jgi:hypothetical protein
MAPFRIGVLHLVVQRAFCKGLDDRGEIASKRELTGRMNDDNMTQGDPPFVTTGTLPHAHLGKR